MAVIWEIRNIMSRTIVTVPALTTDESGTPVEVRKGAWVNITNVARITVLSGDNRITGIVIATNTKLNNHGVPSHQVVIIACE